MEQTTQELIDTVFQLLKEKKYKEVQLLLTDDVLEKHKSAILYNDKAETYKDNNEYDKAIEALNTATKLDPNYVPAYYNRATVLYYQTNYRKSIIDCNKAIQFNKDYVNPYYCKAMCYNMLGRYSIAIHNYNHYIKLKNDPQDYFTKIAISEIEKLKEKILHASLRNIDKLINDIKQLLLFDKTCVTHYTSLSGASAMVLDESEFRLSEGSFLNDPSEGKTLYKYLNFYIAKPNRDETVPEAFIERPFIGSFVDKENHDNLTLWRMYGKELQDEAKGCALTIYKDQFIQNLQEKLSPNNIYPANSQGGQFIFYKVAYKNGDKFLIPGANENDNKKLNQALHSLKQKLESINDNQQIEVNKLLNEIAYLFKSAEYQYEYEVRLVVEGIGFEKIINKNPLKVYIDLVGIVPVLHKITLGPKVERASEWAAAFNYHVKKVGEANSQIKENSENVEIVISHLPFK
jgi:hypothetical protein